MDQDLEQRPQAGGVHVQASPVRMNLFLTRIQALYATVRF
jgi:hypothetical protein